MPCSMDPGLTDHGRRASREQTAQISIALLADAAKPFFASARVLPVEEPSTASIADFSRHLDRLASKQEMSLQAGPTECPRDLA